MFTLQILDRGQTFLHPIDDRTVRIGSGPGVDVVLGEPGVEAEHLRLEPQPGAVRIVALAPTRLNGKPVTQGSLALGDRIEVGRSVLVVGRAVARPASVEDVLADTLPRPRRRAARKQSLLVPVLVAGAVLAVVGWLCFGAPSTQRVHDELASVRRMRLGGQLDRAGEAIQRLSREWQDATDDRLQLLQVERDAIAAIETATERLRQRVLDPSDGRSYAEWSQELQRLEFEGPPDEQVAARRVRANLTATLLERPKVRQPETAPAASEGNGSLVAAGAATKAPVAPGPATVGAPPSPSAPAAPTPRIEPSTSATTTGDTPSAVDPGTVAATSKIDGAEADRLVKQGLFAPAISLLLASLGEQDSEAEVAQLRSRIAGVREQARVAMAKVLEQAAREVAGRDPRAAAQLLHAERHRFPPDADFAALDREIRRCEALAAAAVPPANAATAGAPGAVDERTRAATLATVRAFMDNVRVAEEQGAFAAAATQLRAASEAVRDRDADFAARLLVRADEAELLAAWHDAVGLGLRPGKPIATTHADGRAISLAKVDGVALVGSDGERWSWHDVAPAGVQAIAEQLKVGGVAALGAAALLYKKGSNAGAEALLAKLVRAEPASKERIDRVIARGRGEPFDSRGYALGKDGFQSVRSLEVQKQATQLSTRLEAALRDKSPAVRDAFWTEALAGGPEAVPVLAAALRRSLQQQVARLDAGALRKQVDRLAAQRALLDDARKNAKDLIFDEQKYFYPYKPPAVSSDKFAEYQRVQAEVDRRVAALRTLWGDDRARVRVPASLRADLDRLDWVAKGLADLGELDHGALAPIEWVRALPSGDSVSVRDFCTTVAERDELVEWRRIEAYNAIVGKGLTSAQREQLKITNEYRAMFRHRPLAIVPMICTASQGHAEEMSRLGYFAHMSPTPGRRTPYDRMRLAGYQAGVSENIALVDGAMGAHIAWCHSSGHHRNLLDASHQEMGIGADGRYWVQNFGSGKVHEESPAWAEARAAAR